MKLKDLEVAVCRPAVRRGMDIEGGPNWITYPNIEGWLHEMAHGVTLGYLPKTDMSVRIGNRIADMSGVQSDVNEAKTCAIELLAAKQLGIKGVERKLLNFAALNLIELDSDEFEAEVRRWKKSKTGQRQAKRLLTILKKAVKEEKHSRG